MLLHNLSSIVDGYAADHEKSVSHENVNPNTTASCNAIFYIKRYIHNIWTLLEMDVEQNYIHIC